MGSARPGVLVSRSGVVTDAAPSAARPGEPAGDGQGLLGQVAAAVRALVPDLDFLSPGGVLDLAGPQQEVDRLRLELPGPQYLGLQSIGIDGDVGDIAAAADVRLSSWWRWRRQHFTPQRLFDFDHPSGLVVQTDADQQPWLEIRLERPVRVTRIRLRNAADATASRAAGIRVLAGRSEQHQVVYDQGPRLDALDALLSTRAALSVGSTDLSALLPVLSLTAKGSYAEARKVFEALELPAQRRRGFRTMINQHLLAERELEWTGHGPQRSYRFWSPAEKLDYVGFAAEVAEVLSGLTPYVCFGFGAVLGLVRDGDLIPHDDDLDLIVGFEAGAAPGLQQALGLVEDFLRTRGFTVSGRFSAHRHVSRSGGKHLDVFAGLFEGDAISWYPSPRGLLRRELMFPASQGMLHGIPVPLPHSPLIYLERVYGPDWRRPDPDQSHRWDPSAYADLLPPGWGRKPAGGGDSRAGP